MSIPEGLNMNIKIRKVLSAILTLVMVVGLFAGIAPLPVSAKDDCGYTANASMGRLAELGIDAEAGQCFSISTADDLIAFAEYINSGKPSESVTFYISKDIDLKDVVWEPIAAKSANSFKGTFDGCGFAVLNLNVADGSNVALFGYVEGESTAIKNLGVMGEISGGNTLAGIAANVDGATIANSWNAVDVTGSYNIGGIAGNIDGGKIENCCNYGYISGDNAVGAIAGKVTGSAVIEYSYYVYYSADKACGSVSSNSTAAVYRFASSSTEVLTEKKLTVDNKTTDDLLVLLNEWVLMQNNDFKYRDWVYDNSTSGNLRTDGRYPSHKYPGYIETKDNIYTPTASMTALYESGQNAKNGGCYSISTAEELYCLANYVNAGYTTEGATFFLTSDIIVPEGAGSISGAGWTPIGEDNDYPFRGVFDGQGYIVTGMLITTGNHKGLFGYVDSPNAVIKNLGANGIFTCNDHVGGIVGELRSGSVINCWFSGTVTADDYIGGIVGSCDNGTIVNCCNFSEVVGNRHKGGIVGELSPASQVRYCYYAPDNLVGCGEEDGTISVVIAYEESGNDFSLERAINVGGNPTIKLLNALNHWVTDLAPDQTYRNWKIDDSSESIIRVLGNHPTHLFPGDNSGTKQVDEPNDVLEDQGNPFSVKYLETATMTELYNSGENGVPGGHYSISNGNEMLYLAQYTNSGHLTKGLTFYLTGDISIALQCTGNNHDGWLPIGRDSDLTKPSTYLRYFNGVFDGCGFTVFGLFLSKNEADEAGLFGNLNGATIKNLGVVGDIIAENKVGGIAGEALNSTITNCWTAVNVQAEDRVGGIVGEMSDSTITNCVGYGEMIVYGGSLTALAGGIVGDTDGDCALENCYYMKSTVVNPYEKISSKTTVKNVISFTYGFVGDDYMCTLDKQSVVDEIATTNLLTALNSWVYAQNNGLYSAWYSSAVPIPLTSSTGHFPILMPPDYDEGENENYSGDYEAACTMTELYSMRSDGIEGCAYSISGLDDLEAFQKYVSAGFKTEGITFFMTRDIDMSQKYSFDTQRSWTPIGNVDTPFRGIFDGQGYTIKYLFILTTDEDQGLFGHVTGINALIKNLGVSGSVDATVNAGGIVGDFNFGTIANCWSSCQVTAVENNAGGIVGGANMGHIINCASYGLVVNADAFGGIVGFAFDTELSYCYYLYATCNQAYGLGSTVKENGVQYFNGTSAACVMHEKINVEGTETRNVLSALKLYVDAHPETNYCYWAIGNTKEYLLMGVEFFPVLLSASGTLGDKDYTEVQAYYNGEEYRSLVKAVNAANDNPDGGDVTLATNVVLNSKDNLFMDENVRLLTGDYSLDVKSRLKVQSLQQLDGYYIINKDGGSIWVWDDALGDYQLFMYAKRDADPSCNSEIYGNQSLTFCSSAVKGDYPDAYNLTLQDGEFIVNSTLDSGNPHQIPAGSTITLLPRATLSIAANARIRTTGGNSAIMNGGTVKIGNATLNTNGGTKMVGVFEDDGGVVSLPFVYRDGYSLRGWTDGVNLYPAGTQVDVPTATVLTAQWKIGDSGDIYPGDDYYTDDGDPNYNIPITVIKSEGGTISPDSYKAAKGQNLSFSFTPKTGYYVKSVLLDGVQAELDDNHRLQLVSVSRPHTIVALFAPITNGQYYYWHNTFEDIKFNDWCYDYIRYVSSAGLFNGTSETTFSPDTTMTRDMVVVVLWRLSGCPIVADNGVTFPDVPRTNYAYDAVRWANQFGIVMGFNDGTFGYGKVVTREQLITFLFRYAKNYANDNVGIYDNVNILGYSDVLQISKGMTQPFQWAIGSGIVNGTSDTTLSPKAECTRAQVAAILSRYCNLFFLQVPTINYEQF